jgi:hypothetical protein
MDVKHIALQVSSCLVLYYFSYPNILAKQEVSGYGVDVQELGTASVISNMRTQFGCLPLRVM